MIRTLRLIGALAAALLCAALPVKADFTFTQGTGSNAYSITTGTSGCSGVHCFASVPIDTAGAPLFAVGNGGYVRFPSAQAVTVSSGTITTVTAVTGITNPVAVTGTFWQATQPVSGTVAATQSGTWNVTNAGTFAVQSAPSTAAAWAIGATGSGVPANAVYNGINVAGNLRGPTGGALGSTFSQHVAIVDASGNQITSFGGSGGTASNYGSAFPSSGTAIGVSDGTNMIALRTGTAGSPGTTSVVTVQGVASMTPFLSNPGTAANWGIGATASAVPANAVYAGINVAGNLRGPTGGALGSTYAQHIAIVDGSGNQVTSFGGSGGTASNFGSTFPTAGTAMGASDGTNMVALRTGTSATTSESLAVVIQGGSGLLAPGQATMTNSSPVVIASNQTAIPTSVASAATGGATPVYRVGANSNNSENIKGSAGTVYSVQVSSISTGIAYLKLYDKATAPTCGTDTPVAGFLVPGSSATTGSGNNTTFSVGKNFALGIGVCLVTGIANSDNTAVAANTYTFNIDYK